MLLHYSHCGTHIRARHFVNLAYCNWLQVDHYFCAGLHGMHVCRGMLGIPLKDHEPKTIQAEHGGHSLKLPKRLGLSNP